MQRLFSTFPDGWPGTGLAFLRIVAAIPVVRQWFTGLMPALPVIAMLQWLAAGAALLMLAGLWTPLAGMITAAAELSLALLDAADPWIHFVLGAQGAALAMLGPGAWSVDARLFGRKRIHIPRR